MGEFSQVKAAATCSALSDKAHSMVVRTRRVLQAARDEPGDHDLHQCLGMLSSRLQQLGHHASQLGYLISDASVVHSQFGDMLQFGLADCQTGLTIVSDGFDAGGSVADDRDAVTGYLSFAAAFVGLFVLAGQLLIIETEQEQKSKLVNPGAKAIVNAAHSSLERLLSFSYKIRN
ncbi:hypothetical protein F5144DRAFT_559250 [Chaetomium tenue]|uniref:Uncharacterized protein n=1 Tax=Chaetomium tenue TaxID=1854479 RepID=A0ACB7PU88_9PEZI|nr:hypothetical protein F5144DRAFT_559250 [Chaetomium globosum]